MASLSKPHPHPSFTAAHTVIHSSSSCFFLPARICCFLVFLLAAIHYSHSFTHSGLMCVRGWQALRSWIKKAIWWRGKQRWLHWRRKQKWNLACRQNPGWYNTAILLLASAFECMHMYVHVFFGIALHWTSIWARNGQLKRSELVSARQSLHIY